MFISKKALGAVVAVAGLATGAQAEDLLIVDLSVANQVTISATSGAASANASGSTFTGFYLENAFGNQSSAPLGALLVSGNLTPTSNTSDNSPSLFNLGGNAGLNVWSYSAASTGTFTAGQQAFTGAATWNISAGAYADLLDGPSGGNIYFAADSDDDLSAATVIGQWRIIPAPSSLALLGLGGLVAGRRRR